MKSRAGVFLWIAAAVGAVSGCNVKENPIVIEEKVTQQQLVLPRQNKPEEDIALNMLTERYE